MGVSGVKSIVAQARRAAQRRGQEASTAHLLLAMLQGGGPVSELLLRHGVGEGELLRALGEGEAGSAMPRVLDRSAKIAEHLGHGEVSAFHLLLAIARDRRSAAHRSLGEGLAGVQGAILARMECEPAAPPAPRPLPPPMAPRRAVGPVRRSLPRRPSASRGPAVRGEARRRHKTPKRPSARPRQPGEAPRPPAPADAIRVQPRHALEPEGLLASLGRDLTALAAAGRLDPVIGRDAEIETLLDILARRRGNSPVLVGPSGVGKTAVVEGLAQRLASGAEGTRGLAGRPLVELTAGSLVRGTGVRGALAERLQQLRAEVAASGALLFIDEIHAVLGGAEGPDDLAQELKAALARGELSCVGATTEAEFRRHVEKDPALVRRLTPVPVGEPDAATTRAILAGVLPRYADFHDVQFAPEASAAAVELSARFLPELKLPDKALAVLDHAAARVSRRGGQAVDRAAVAAVVAERAEVPLERILLTDRERLLGLEDALAARVVGHAAVVTEVAEALRKGAAGLRGRRRPLGTFLFLGPTGVGKTELAKAMHHVFFGGGALTRFDMSELSEAHGVARLLGSPPGYVGHGAGGQLTESVRRRPYQLVLLDEVEKAHPDVLLALLPLLDEGRLTDGVGRTVDFTNTIVVMTSNLGASAATRRPVGFGASGEPRRPGVREAEAALAAARAALPPELFNRIDAPLAFAPLRRDEVRVIAARRLRDLAARLAEAHGVVLEVETRDLDRLLELGGFDPELGARPLERVIGRYVESPLARRVLEGLTPGRLALASLLPVPGSSAGAKGSGDGGGLLVPQTLVPGEA